MLRKGQALLHCVAPLRVLQPAVSTGWRVLAQSRLDAFSVREYEVAGEQRRDWTKIGAAFEHGDGKGWNIVLHCLPIDGKVVLRLPEPREPAA